MLAELRFAWRSLVKTPGFTLVAVLILALGIGANTAVFSVVEAVLIRPLPYSRPAELFSLRSATVNQAGLLNIPEFCEFRDHSRAFSGIAAVGTINTNLVDEGEAQLVQGLRLSAGTFELLGVRPAAGRLLVPSDDAAGAGRVAVIGNGLWQSRFGGRPEAVGRRVSIGGEPYTIVGVLPPEFVLPVNGFHSDICLPLKPDTDPMRNVPSSLHYLRAFARLAPGVGAGQALDDCGRILRGLREQFPKDFTGNAPNRLVPLVDEVVGDTRPVLYTLLSVVGALLLLACSNLAGLLLVRAMGRQRELAIRSALGGSRYQLARLLLAESLLLAAAGGAAGLLLAQWGVDTLLAIVPAGLPRAHELRFNGAIFGFAAAVSLVAGLAPSLAPLWFFSRADLRGSISSGGRGSTRGAGHLRLRHFLAAVQVALAVALLACTALFLRSFWAVGSQRLGFDPSHTLTARLTLPEAGYRDPDSLIRYYERLSARLAAIPGVEEVGTTSLLPLASGLATANFTVAGRPLLPESEHPSANYRLVSPGFFPAMGMALREGRGFTERDDPQHPLVAVVGTALADAFFPDHRVLGERLQVEDPVSGYRTAEIVGVVADVKQTKLEDAPSFDLYISQRQMVPVAVPWLRFRTFWVLRTSGAPQAVEAAMRREIRAVDPGVPVASVQTLAEVAHSAMAVRRFSLVIIGIFAGVALLLTVAGIYAVIAYGVEQRTRELGVRLALGASRGQILWLVLSEGCGLVGTGAALGVAAALGLSQLVAAQLYGVGPRDPAALAASVLLLFAVAFFACLLPARRATRVDPLVALQAE